MGNNAFNSMVSSSENTIRILVRSDDQKVYMIDDENKIYTVSSTDNVLTIQYADFDYVQSGT